MRNRGFTLIEFGVVLFIGSIVLAFAIPLLNDYRKDVKKIELMNQHIAQFKMLNNAAANWAGSTFDDLSDNSSGTVSVDVLKTNNYLPNQFAFQYSDTVSQDILGNEFKIFWNKKELEYMGVLKQRVRTLVVADSPMQWQNHPQKYVPNIFSRIEDQNDYISFVDGWYSMLMNKAAAKDLVVGVIKNNSNTIVGFNQSFKFVLDTSDFNIPQRPYKRIVVFHGWPDINDLGSEGGNNGGGEETEIYSQCKIGGAEYEAYIVRGGGDFVNYHLQGAPINTCSAGLQPFANLSVTNLNQPSPLISLPGWVPVFATIEKTLVSNLGSMGSYCSYRALAWCNAKTSGQCDPFNNKTIHDEYVAHIQACNIEPIYNYEIVLNVAGSTYRRDSIYKYGQYNIGRVNGTDYEVATIQKHTSNIANGSHYIVCCPPDAPPLD